MLHLFVEQPQLIILKLQYQLHCIIQRGEGGHQGGGVAAPVGGQIFSEVLPYLEVNQGNQEEIETIEEVTVPNVTGLSIKEAEKILKELGLEISFENDENDAESIEENMVSLDKENTIIKEQTPIEGITINKGNKIFVQY